MSLVTSIKDSIEILNNLYDSKFENLTTVDLVSQLVVLIFSNIRSIFVYILTFQWFRDFSYLPILVPNGISSILQENFVLDDPMSQIFSLLEAPSFSSNKFLIGFLNSFFLILPISCAHFITIRRLLIQGIPAGISSAIGTIFGQLCFITCILFGIRGFLIPLVGLEPLSYIVGFVLVTSIVYDMAHEKAIRLISLSQKKQLLTIFGLNFALAWTEQACFFQYFGNLSINPEPSLLEIGAGETKFSFLIDHSFYLVGILFGSLCFSALFGAAGLGISNFLSVRICRRVSTWIKRLNFSLLLLIFGFSLTSLPYYGIDYVLGGPLGFVSQDAAFEATVFARTTLKNYKLEQEQEQKQKKPIETFLRVKPNTDISLFGRGDYLPRFVPKSVSFEQLNYGDTKLWLNWFKRSKSGFRFRQTRAKRARENFFKKLNTAQLIQWNVDGDKLKLLKLMQQHVNDLTIQEQKLNKVATCWARSAKQAQAILTSTPEARGTNGTALREDEQITSTDELDESEFEGQQNRDPYLEKNYNSNAADTLAKMSGDELIEQRFYDQKIVRLEQEKFQKLQARTFTTGFFSCSQTRKPKIGKEFSQKQYYISPIYRLLLNTDIDTFIRRQPKTHSLTIAEENQLVDKRLALADYYNSLRYYMELPYVNAFQDAFQGSKSYADRVFNQQFKGTLKTVRRLFSVNLAANQPLPGDLSEPTFSKRVLKYDQPLFNDKGPSENFLLHEELSASPPNYTTSPFLSLANSQPVYAGWDNQQRKFVITNRYLPTSFAGGGMKPPFNFSKQKKTELNKYSDLENNLNSKTQLEFTTWPLSKQILEDPKTKKVLAFKVLFELKKDPRNQLTPWKSIFEIPMSQELADLQKQGVNLEYNTLPSSIKRTNLSPTVNSRLVAQDLLPPTRGGFVWPGTEKLKFSFYSPSKKNNANKTPISSANN